MDAGEQGLEPTICLEDDVRAARSGDMDALERVLVHAGRSVRSRVEIPAKWRSAIDVDDVMQVSYIDAFTRFHQFAGDSPATAVAWLMQIARNNLRDAIRTLERDKRPQPERRLRPMSGSDSYTELFTMLGATTTTPSRVASAQEVRQLVELAISRLPQRYAEAIRCFDLEGLSGEAAADRMGCSRAAAFMLRARSRDRLRELIASELQFSGDTA